MRLNVRYFAKLKEEAGAAQESWETSATTVAGLWSELAAHHRFSLDARLIRAAQNDEFCDWEAPLTPGGTIVFMPPVAGG